MKKHKLLLYAILLVAMALPQSVFAYDFSAVSPSGDTLYYTVVSGGVRVTYPGATFSNPWGGYTQPSGALTIPSTVTYEGTTYSVTSIGGYAFKNCSGLTSVTIPNSVTSIGDNAFYYCSALTSVTIPNSVTSIGNNAFYNCTGLSSVTIPNSVTSIGSDAFKWVRHIEYHGSATGSRWGAISMNGVVDGDFVFYDSSRTELLAYLGSGGSVSIPSTVITIGSYAFYNCAGLTSVTIPNSVTSIGNSVFSNCTGLTSVTIPNSVTYIGYNAFYNIKHIEYHGSASGSPWGAISMNGVVDGDFVFSDNSETNLLAYLGSGGSVSIPSTVTSISSLAFHNCYGLTSVTIPNSVTSIDGFAFYGCTSLTSITIPNSVTSIGDHAFYLCTNLTIVNFNALNCTFSGDSSPFSDCTNLTTLNIGDSVTNIPHVAFYGCTSLTSVIIGSGVTSIGYYAFYGCTSLTSVTIPNSVTSIGDNAFYGCTGLTSVTIPSSVTYIGINAFGACTGLTSITISSGITSIGSSVFRNCTGLASVTIPSSVTSIGSNAFRDCTGLTSVTIPSSVTSIGGYAFLNCTGLSSVTIPNSVTSIGSDAFYYVRHIEYHGTATGSPWGALSMNGVTDGDFVFSDSSRTNLLAYIGSRGIVSIPSTVTSIGYYAFYNCAGLTSVTIPNSVTFIGHYAFAYCSGLTSVIVQNDNPPTIGYYTFDDVPNNCSLTVPCESDSLYRASSWGGWFSNITEDCSVETYYDFYAVSPSGDTLYYIILDSNNVTVVHPFASDTTEQAWWDGAVQPSGALTIPGSVTHNDTTYNVVRISEHAFYNCNAITSVTIPSTVDSIGEWAFAYNTSLTTVTMGSAVTTIGYGAFYGCTGLNNLVIPDSLITIGSHAFSIPNCHVSAVSIPNTVTTIGDHAFSGWGDLTTLTIPRLVSYIGDWAFAACTSLATVNFYADSCIYMGSTTAPVFDDDINIQTLHIGNTVKTIPANAFYGCSGIGTVTVPASVSSIGSNAFAGCTGLTSITSKRAVAPLAGANAFANIPASTPVYIPCGSTASYASRWSRFTNFIEVLDAHVWVRSADAAMGTASVSVQPTCDTPYATVVATPNAGYLFALWSDGDTLNPRTLMIDRDTTLTAFFVPMPDTITNYDTIIVHDTLMIHDTTIVNHYIIDTTIVHDTSYVEVYIQDTTIVHDTSFIEVYVHDTTFVHDTSYVEVYIHDTAFVHDTAYVHDTTIVNIYIYDTIIVNNYIHDTAYVHDTTIVNNYIHDTVIVNNYIHDTVIVNNYIHDTVIVDNYIHDTIYLDRYIYDTIYIHDTIYIQGEGIEDVALLNAKIYQRNGLIVVEGAEGNPVYLYDVVGRLLATKRETAQEVLLDVPASGAYLVKIGDAPAQRIVVRR